MNNVDSVNAKLDGVLNDCPLVMRPAMEHLRLGRGKNIRAALVLATAECLGGINENVVNLAAGIEILHLATLIHDDIIDDAKTRRGIESLYLKFGKKTAVLTGDFLFTKCFSLISNENRNRVGDLAGAVSAICAGEMLQQQNNKNLDLTVRQYYKIIAGKTAALFALCLYGAAYEAGAGEAYAQRLGKAGYNIGMVFQMIDDCLDYEGNATKIKKSAFMDLSKGVVTYPLIYAMQKDPAIKALLSGRLTAKSKADIISRVQACGGPAETRRQAKVFYDRAMKKVCCALDGKNPDKLAELMHVIYTRDN